VSLPLARRGLGRVAADDGTRDTVIDMTTAAQAVFYFERILKVYMSHVSGTQRRNDTITCKYTRPNETIDEILGKMDSIRANPLAFLRPYSVRGAIRMSSTEWQTYWIRDLDNVVDQGSGQGTMDWAEYAVYTVNTADSSVFRKRVRIYGKDSAYARPGAPPEEYELLRRAANRDTLEWTLVKDLTGTRRLWNDSGTGRVELSLRARNPAAQPDLVRMHVLMRADLRHNEASGDSLKQLSYFEQRWLRNGRISTFSLQGVRTGSPLMVPNDSARMTVDTVYALRDSMIRYSALYDLRLGPAPERMQEHSLLGYRVNKFWRSGLIASTTSKFESSAPVPMGQAGGFQGEMDVTAAYANGDTVQTTGTISGDSLNLVLRQVKQGVTESYHVILDTAGKLLASEKLTAPADATRIAPRRPEDP
jgi:hypothetical protein